MDGVDKAGRDLVALTHALVVAEGSYALGEEGGVEAVGEAVAGVFASEGKEHVPTEPECRCDVVFGHFFRLLLVDG